MSESCLSLCLTDYVMKKVLEDSDSTARWVPGILRVYQMVLPFPVQKGPEWGELVKYTPSYSQAVTTVCYVCSDIRLVACDLDAQSPGLCARFWRASSWV